MNNGYVSIAATALLGMALGGCATTPDQKLAGNTTIAGLGGTSWKLVELQSMDDAQGTTKFDQPDRYTLAFAKDGSVAVRLDCNRGVGSWASANAGATGGSLQFGPMAVTKALCPPSSFGPQLEKQLGYVRSFSLRDGKLYMSLMADGGILVWQPASG